jgi:hypothetical protein
MEHSFRARAGRIDCGFVGNVGFDDFQPRIAVMLLKIGTPADDETIQHADVPAVGDQTIDKVTSNKARAASYQIHSLPADRPMLASSTPAY